MSATEELVAVGALTECPDCGARLFESDPV
jgi:hypothetical protein